MTARRQQENLHLNFFLLNDIETYVQEVDRGGRDGSPTYAILYFSAQLKRFVDKDMLEYCEQDNADVTNFLVIFTSTLAPQNTGCKCCDFCKKNCTYSNCFADTNDMLFC